MPTEYYTQERKKKGVIEYCPNCNKKGLVHRYVKIDQYVHSKTYKDSKLFRHVLSEEKCDVLNPEKEQYHLNVTATIQSVIPNIHKYNDFSSAQIVRGFHNGISEDDMVLSILNPFIDRMNKQIEVKQGAVILAQEILNRIHQDNSVS